MYGAIRACLAVDPSNTFLYFAQQDSDGSGNQSIHQYDMRTGEETTLSSPILDGATISDGRGGSLAGLMGLECDLNGKLYTVSSSGPVQALNAVYRIDPGTGEVEAIGQTGRAMQDLAVDDDGTLYLCPPFVSDAWIYRLVAGLAVPWADPIDPPANLFTLPTSITASGGKVFICDYYSNGVYRYMDSDGDGFARTIGEEGVRFSTFPFTEGGTPTLGGAPPKPFGLRAYRSGQVVIANLSPGGTTSAAAAGIYWFVDRTGDGLAMDPADRVHYSGQAFWNEFDGGCVSLTGR
jgi:hypothetical protein